MGNPLAAGWLCCFLILLVPGVLFLLTYIFRQSCVLCGLPRPSVLTAFGVMMLIRVSTFVPEAIMNVIVSGIVQAGRVPRWEASLIIFFLFLPIDLLISAGLHAGLMSIKFGKGIEVWFVQMLIYPLHPRGDRADRRAGSPGERIIQLPGRGEDRGPGRLPSLRQLAANSRMRRQLRPAPVSSGLKNTKQSFQTCCSIARHQFLERRLRYSRSRAAR